MQLHASFRINGMTMLNETFSYGEVTSDGRWIMRFPPMGHDEAQNLAMALTHPATLVAVEIDIQGLPTIEEIATRLAAVERAVQ